MKVLLKQFYCRNKGPVQDIETIGSSVSIDWDLKVEHDRRIFKKQSTHYLQTECIDGLLLVTLIPMLGSQKLTSTI